MGYVGSLFVVRLQDPRGNGIFHDQLHGRDHYGTITIIEAVAESFLLDRDIKGKHDGDGDDGGAIWVVGIKLDRQNSSYSSRLNASAVILTTGMFLNRKCRGARI